MPEGVNNYMNLFSDDAKLVRQVKNEDCKILQENLNKIWRWSRKWEMEFNVDKSCYRIGKGWEMTGRDLQNER